MIPPNALSLVRDLHACYCARTGYDIAYNMARENVWREWCAFGEWKWTTEDLARVIVYLRGEIRRDKRNEGALKFANLIGRPDNFEEDLNLAREARQNSGLKPRRSSVRPTESEPAEILDAAEAAKLWREQFKPEAP